MSNRMQEALIEMIRITLDDVRRQKEPEQLKPEPQPEHDHHMEKTS